MNAKTLSAALLDKAASLRLSLAGMHCSATSDYKAGALKAAAVLEMMAKRAERMTPDELAEDCRRTATDYLRASKAHRPGTAAKSEYVQGAKALMDAAEVADSQKAKRNRSTRIAPDGMGDQGAQKYPQSLAEALGTDGLAAEEVLRGVLG